MLEKLLSYTGMSIIQFSYTFTNFICILLTNIKYRLKTGDKVTETIPTIGNSYFYIYKYIHIHTYVYIHAYTY